MPITHIKIFGERNTGTNWCERLLGENLDATIIHHRGIIPKYTTEADKKRLMLIEKPFRKFAREALTDRIFDGPGRTKMGWKHASVHLGMFQDHPLFEMTGFVCLTKHPSTFLASLFKRPYHDLLPKSESLDAFVRRPWLPTKRDGLEEIVLPTPLALWNQKVSSYCALEATHVPVIIISYESLLSDLHGALERIADTFHVRCNFSTVVEQSTKGDKMTFEDYREKYLTSDPMAAFSPDNQRFILDFVDKNIFDRFGYKMS